MSDFAYSIPVRRKMEIYRIVVAATDTDGPAFRVTIAAIPEAGLYDGRIWLSDGWGLDYRNSKWEWCGPSASTRAGVERWYKTPQYGSGEAWPSDDCSTWWVLRDVSPEGLDRAWAARKANQSKARE